MAGIVFQRRVAEEKLSTAEKAYAFVCWGRIVMGALSAVVALLLVPPGSAQTTMLIMAIASIVSGIALLFEVEWVQFLVYYGSILSIIGGVLSLAANSLGGDAVGIVIGVFDLAFSILTVWAIRQIADV